MYTLLKQGPSGKPAVRKAIIVCPSSLVGNWCKEIAKWLDGRLKPMPLEVNQKALAKIAAFQYKDYHVLVISYDQLKIHAQDLAKVSNIGTHLSSSFSDSSDLIVCDEGHRIKNAETATSKKLRLLKAEKRIILSGTPIQNDLEEFFSMADFINPGYLGDLPTFRNVYQDKIMKGGEADADPEDKEGGKRRSAGVELSIVSLTQFSWPK